jgi:hypothetical protein
MAVFGLIGLNPDLTESSFTSQKYKTGVPLQPGPPVLLFQALLLMVEASTCLNSSGASPAPCEHLGAAFLPAANDLITTKYKKIIFLHY